MEEVTLTPDPKSIHPAAASVVIDLARDYYPVSISHERDPSWRWTCPHGHVHRWQLFRGAWRVSGVVVYDHDYDDEVQFCSGCMRQNRLVEVPPGGTRLGKTNRMIAGLLRGTMVIDFLDCEPPDEMSTSLGGYAIDWVLSPTLGSIERIGFGPGSMWTVEATYEARRITRLEAVAT